MKLMKLTRGFREGAFLASIGHERDPQMITISRNVRGEEVMPTHLSWMSGNTGNVDTWAFADTLQLAMVAVELIDGGMDPGEALAKVGLDTEPATAAENTLVGNTVEHMNFLRDLDRGTA